MKLKKLSALMAGMVAISALVNGCGGGGGDASNGAASAPTNNNGTVGSQPDYASAIAKSTIVTPIVVPLPSPRANASNKAYFGRYMYVRNIAPVDVNGDGLDDLIAAPSFFDQHPLMPIELWINQGDGHFVNQTADWIEGVIPTTTFSTAILVADFNNDGRQDVFISQSGLEDLDCLNPGCDGGKNLLLLSQPGGRLRDVTATNLPGNDAAFNHVVSSVGDLNGDGLIDIAVPRLGSPKQQADGVVVYLNQGGGNFSIAGSAVVPEEIVYSPFASLGGKPSSFDRQSVYSTAIADVDDDGKAELLTASSGYGDLNTNARTIRIFKWDATQSKLVEAARFAIAPALADIQNVGFPGAQLPPPEHNGLGCSHISVADADGDGKPDVLLNWESWTESYVQLMQGQGGFAFHDVTMSALGTHKTSYTNLGQNWAIMTQQFQDVSGDGRPDIVLGSGANTASLLSEGSPAAAWINSGTGTFEKQRALVHGATLTGDSWTRYLGCSFCGYATYYGRFIRRADGRKTLDMLLVTGSEDTRRTPVEQEASISLRVVPAR